MIMFVMCFFNAKKMDMFELSYDEIWWIGDQGAKGNLKISQG